MKTKYVGMVIDKGCLPEEKDEIGQLFDTEPMYSMMMKQRFEYIDKGLLKD